jgi:hypothetical protein
VWLLTGFGLNFEFLDHLYTQLVTTINYKILPSIYHCTHSTQKVLSSKSDWFLIATDHFLQTHVENWLGCTNYIPYNSLGRPAQKTQFPLSCLSVAVGTCLPSSCLATAVSSYLLRICWLETDVIPLSFSRPFPRHECYFRALTNNGCFSGSTVLTLSKYATIWNVSIAKYVLLCLRQLSTIEIDLGKRVSIEDGWSALILKGALQVRSMEYKLYWMRNYAFLLPRVHLYNTSIYIVTVAR